MASAEALALRKKMVLSNIRLVHLEKEEKLAALQAPKNVPFYLQSEEEVARAKLYRDAHMAYLHELAVKVRLDMTQTTHGAELEKSIHVLLTQNGWVRDNVRFLRYLRDKEIMYLCLDGLQYEICIKESKLVKLDLKMNPAKAHAILPSVIEAWGV